MTWLGPLRRHRLRRHRLRTHRLRTHRLRMKKAALDIHAVLSVPAVLIGAMPLRARHVHGAVGMPLEIYRNLPKFTEISGREALRLENTGP
jgi:hypothetical protein